MSSTDRMYQKFKLSSQDFEKLEKAFVNLLRKQSWMLLKANSHNNHDLQYEDAMQNQYYSLIVGGCYLKRQKFLQDSFAVCEKYAKTKKDKALLDNLKNLWDNRKSHGAGRKRFGDKEEDLLDALVEKIVPKAERPTPSDPLEIDAVYLKSILWNNFRGQGKQITRLKPLYDSLVSLSEFDYLSSVSEI